MKRCVVCGRETYHKVEEYTVCAACDVDGSFDYYIKQSIAAQQGVQPTVESGRELPAEVVKSVSVLPAISG